MYRIKQALLPTLCFACQSTPANEAQTTYPARLLCKSCYHAFFSPKPALCEWCSDELPPRVLDFGWTRCRHCRQEPTNAQVLACHPYFAPIDEWIKALKYDGQWQMAKPLGRWMAQSIKKKVDQGLIGLPDCLVPIPSSKAKLKLRGYNQAELLANELSKQLKVPIKRGLLIKRLDTHSQASQNKQERLTNLQHAFASARNAQVPTRIALVDDVVTTGGTIEACAKVLQLAGAEEVLAFALAKTPV